MEAPKTKKTKKELEARGKEPRIHISNSGKTEETQCLDTVRERKYIENER